MLQLKKNLISLINHYQNLRSIELETEKACLNTVNVQVDLFNFIIRSNDMKQFYIVKYPDISKKTLTEIHFLKSQAILSINKSKKSI